MLFIRSLLVIYFIYVCVCAQSLSLVQLCDSTGWGPPGSSVRGILQARVLEWAAISFFRGSSRTRDCTHVSCLVGGFFTSEPCGKPYFMSISYLNIFYIYFYLSVLGLILACGS